MGFALPDGEIWRNFKFQNFMAKLNSQVEKILGCQRSARNGQQRDESAKEREISLSHESEILA